MSLVNLLKSFEEDNINSKCFLLAILYNHHNLWSSIGKQFRFLLAVCGGATIAPLIRMPILFLVIGSMSNLIHLAIAIFKEASL